MRQGENMRKVLLVTDDQNVVASVTATLEKSCLVCTSYSGDVDVVILDHTENSERILKEVLDQQGQIRAIGISYEPQEYVRMKFHGAEKLSEPGDTANCLRAEFRILVEYC